MEIKKIEMQVKVKGKYKISATCQNADQVGHHMLAYELADKYLCKCRYITRIVRKQHYNYQEYIVYYHKDFGGGRKIYTLIE